MTARVPGEARPELDVRVVEARVSIAKVEEIAKAAGVTKISYDAMAEVWNITRIGARGVVEKSKAGKDGLEQKLRELVDIATKELMQ